MTLLAWRDDYSVGSPVIDKEHRQLFDLINDFYDHQQGERGALVRLLNQLIVYAEAHFLHEEKIMAKSHFPKLEAHQQEHEKLVTIIFALTADIESGKSEMNEQTIKFMRHWLLDHILSHDMEYAEFMRGEGK